MELVTGVRPPKFKNPRIQIIYSVPKAGKTTILGALEDNFIIELEPGGADYISARVQEVYKASEFNQVLDAILKSPDKVSTYLTIDTITKLDEWSEIVGTYNYMGKPQGKKFNRVGEVETGAIIYHTDPKFDTVHSLGQGFGYKYSREAMTDWYDKFLEIIAAGKVDYIILVAHVKDKLVESRNGDSVETIDVNLTGKVKSIYASRVDAIGHFYRENTKGYISYNNEFKIVCGGRCSHLDGSIQVSEKQPDGSIKVDWSKIYTKE
jgi:hypothetical protein